MAEAAAPPPAGTGTAPEAVKLDDLMLAMDVVDTLRRQDAFVARELDEDARERELISRLRKIYRDQGIEVSDATIEQGVQGLKESRFVYQPPKPGLGVSLAKLWIARGRIGAILSAAVGAIGLLWAGYYFLSVRPARVATQLAEEEFANLPQALSGAHNTALNDAKAQAARDKADELLAAGEDALSREDAAGAKKALAQLQNLDQKLRLTYQLMIVSRPGEQSGVFRTPDRSKGARNYYLIVEAIGADGRPIALPVTSEEDGKTVTTTKWGLRVDQRVYDAVAADKADDGIIQHRKVGEKQRGFLEVDYTVPATGAAITQW